MRSAGLLSRRRWTLLLVVLGIVLRIAALIGRWDRPLTGEADDYRSDARTILADAASYVPRRPVGLPASMALSMAALGDTIAAMRLVALGFGVSSLLLGALLARRCLGSWGPLAVAWIALSPSQVIESTEPLSQMPVQICTLVIALLLSRRWQDDSERSWLHGIPIGIAAAAATLFRTAGATLVLAPWIVPRRRHWLKQAAVAGAVFALMIGGAVFRNWRVAGELVPLSLYDSKNLFYGNNRFTPLYKTWVQGNRAEKATGTRVEREYLAAPAVPGDPVATSRDYWRAAVREISGRPDLFAVRTVNRVRCWFGFDTNSGAILIRSDGRPEIVGLLIIAVEAVAWTLAGSLGVVAMVLAWRRMLDLELSRSCRLLFRMIVLLAIPYAVSFSHPTYHGPAFSLVAVLAGAGARCLWMNRTELRESARPIAAGIALFVYVQVEWFLMMIDRI